MCPLGKITYTFQISVNGNKMKVAILISGSPRFYSGLDITIKNLLNYDKADWYCQLWKDNPPPDKLGYDDHILVAPTWRNVNKEWAIEKISKNLPEKHELMDLLVYDNSLIQYPIITGPTINYDNFESMWKMHLGWNLADNLRKKSGVDYDLIIRARPDLHLTAPLDLSNIKNILDRAPKSVIVSNGEQHGYGYRINDLLAVTTPNNMSIYTDLINHTVEYNNRGIVFHPETLLAYHLLSKGLTIKPLISAEIRFNYIKTPDGKITVDFGNWI